MPTVTILNRKIERENLPEFTKYLFKNRIKDRRRIMPKVTEILKERNQADIKEQIRLYEIRKNGLSKTCGTSVEVQNLRINKDEYIADVVFQEEDFAEIYNNCKYPKELFKGESK